MIAGSHRQPLLLLCLAMGLVFSAKAEPLLIGGTGSAEPIVRLLFEEFSKQAPEASLTIISPPLGSGGAIKALGMRRIDMAVVARPPKAEEAAGIGRRFELAITPFVLASSNGQRRTGFTLDELAKVYEGRLKTWDQGDPIRLVLRTPDESDTSQLMSMSPAMAKAVNFAYQRQGMATGMDDLDTLDLITHTPGSLGSTNVGLLRASGSRLSIFPINGVTPSIAALNNGSYPWHKTHMVVLPVQPSPMAEKFASFLRSDKAKALLRRYEYLPSQ